MRVAVGFIGVGLVLGWVPSHVTEKVFDKFYVS